MILIADGGSTKTHWCLLANNGDANDFFTDGINPFFQTSDAMQNSVSNQLLPQIAHLMWVGPITHVFYYGAGCTPEKIPYVKRALQAVFKKSEVEVESDMLGAARALLGNKQGVACILGTGSNSCQYDGKQFVKNVPALGFILGDEGSGAVLGKRLVADLLKDQMSKELKDKFLAQYNTSPADIIENVYRKPFPNRFLAKLSEFAAENIDNPMIYSLVYDHFNQFVVRNLKQYPNNLPVGFVGSIAYYYRDVLEKVMTDNGFSIADILQDPTEGLKKYHESDFKATQD